MDEYDTTVGMVSQKYLEIGHKELSPKKRKEKF